jgi:hypothetical protein
MVVATPLCDRVRAMCSDVEGVFGPGRATEGVVAIRDRLAESTPRIAVGGKLKAGKSTLVNALLGQRLAATNGTETTMVVAWYRHYHHSRILVRPYDGAPYYIPSGPGGRIPADLRRMDQRTAGLPDREGNQEVAAGLARRIASVTVEVPNRRLVERHIIVDTPGLGSLTGLDEASLAGLTDADALLYLMPHPSSQDRAVLTALRAAAGAARMSAATVLGVLSQVDLLGERPDDVWPGARRVAGRTAGQLRGLLADVIPVVGLLAETAFGDEFTEADTRLLVRLAAADRAPVRRALYKAESFLAWDGGPLDPADRKRLLDMLGVYGLTHLLAAIDGGVRSTKGLLDTMEELSGIRPVLDYVDRHFVAGADRLRARAALERLEAVMKQAVPASTDGQQVLDRVTDEMAQLRRHPLLLQTKAAEALAALVGAAGTTAGGRLAADEAAVGELLALATGSDLASMVGLATGTPSAEVAAAADAALNRWRTRESRPIRAPERRAISAAIDLCHAIHTQATAPA